MRKMQKIILSSLMVALFWVWHFSNIKMSNTPFVENEKGLMKDFAAEQETTDFEKLVSGTTGQTRIKNAKFLKNLDDSEDYVYTEFEAGGYAIFYKNSMEMLEYSPTKQMPAVEDNVYYCGPQSSYVKNGGKFKNIETHETITIENEQLAEKANKIRSAFSKRKKTKSIQLDFSKDAPFGASSHNIDTQNPIKLSYGTRIPNHTYFEISPRHGENTTGTCGAVAAEMLLTYHNYYSDRRIIPNNFLNGNSSNDRESNPNYCADPIRMTHETLGAKGTLEVESDNDDNYFAKIVKVISKNAAYSTVTSGLKKILNERKNSIGDTFKYNVEDKYGGWLFGSLKVNTSRVVTEIDNGNPSIVLMQSNLGGTNHFVVAYGYKRYTYPGTSDTYDGFITNFGWGMTTQTFGSIHHGFALTQQ